MAYTYNPPEKNTAPTNSTDESNEQKARIWNVFETKIVLDEISLPSDGGSEAKKYEDLASVQFPLIKINDYILLREEINSFRINSYDRVPDITLTVTFSNEIFLSKNMPKDGDLISVAIRSKSDLLKPIRNDYVITSVIAGRRETLSTRTIQTMTFYGKLFIPGWDSYRKTIAKKGTSMESLKGMAQYLGLGFSTNEENTDDLQMWVACNTPSEFVEDTAEKCWKHENAFFDWWIDVYYNLNFVNVQKQLLAPEEEIDEGAIISNVDKDYWWGLKEDETVGVSKVFSNYQSFRSTSFYIKTWRPVNKSSQITFDYGASLVCTFFEHLYSLYTNPDRQKYWSLEIAPDYDPEKTDSHIILRGRTTYDPAKNDDELARSNYNYGEIYKKYPWMGIQYTINNPEDDVTEWTGNHHRNYMRAQIHNAINLAELDKLNVEISTQGLNLNVIRGDKIPLALIRKDRTENLMVSEEFNTAEALDLFYSGWYYVNGFDIAWTGGDNGDLSSFSHSFSLTRREWPTPLPSAKRNEINEE